VFVVIVFSNCLLLFFQTLFGAVFYPLSRTPA